MGNIVSKLHTMFHRASLIIRRSNCRHTPMCQKTDKSIRIQKLIKSTYKIFFSGASRKAPLGNIVRKLHAKTCCTAERQGQLSDIYIYVHYKYTCIYKYISYVHQSVQDVTSLLIAACRLVT